MVKFWKKKQTWDKPFSEKIAKRIARIPTGQLAMWADQSLYGIGVQIRAVETNASVEALTELLEGAEALYAVVYELNKRMRSTL